MRRALMRTERALGAVLGLAAAALPLAAQAEALKVTSPNGRVEIVFDLDAAQQATYAISFNGQTVIAPSPLGLNLDKGGRLGAGLTVTGAVRRTADTTYTLPFAKVSIARDRYNELAVDLRETGAAGRALQLVFRAYDDGAAFRYRLPQQPELEAAVIRSELTEFDFPADYACWGLNLGRFDTAHEGEYDPVRASHMRPHHLYEASLVCRTGAGETTFAIAEADLKNYAGMYLQGRADGGLGVQARLSPRLEDRKAAVRTRIGSDILSPWRVVMLGETPGRLIESTLITNLNPDPDPALDFSWVKPGKAAWDWWNGPTLASVPDAGMNNETLVAFIDFAAEAGLEYMLIDEGWYAGAGGGGTVRPGVDVTRTRPEIDLPFLVDYARRKGVGLWLWLNWQALDAQMEEALAFYAKLGIKGIKVDFMDRDDQEMVDWFHKVLAATARHRLMINLHGAYKPTGLIRTWPHFLTQEGVLGAEYNKWTRRITAGHNVMLAYTRLLLGPMDYTPGGFLNVKPEDFTIRLAPPFVQTTRGQGLAMYVVYDSPFGVVADSPDNLRGQPGLDFISLVPTTWDEIRVLGGAFGESIVIARRKGKDWFVGAMTNEQGRTTEVPLDFLGNGRYALTSWTDGDAPAALNIETRTLGANDRAPVRLTLAPSGGGVLHFKAE